MFIIILRLRLLEMGVHAALVDLKEAGSSTTAPKSNVLHLMRLIYDLIVLDPNKDDTKKCSSKLLDGVLALLGNEKHFFLIFKCMEYIFFYICILF